MNCGTVFSDYVKKNTTSRPCPKGCDEEEEDEASIMYKTRKMPYPPRLFPERDNWTALCMQCYSYSTIGNNDSESIKHIRHAKNCSFHKEWKRFARKDRERVIQQFFKIIPPLKKPKKVS